MKLKIRPEYFTPGTQETCKKNRITFHYGDTVKRMISELRAETGIQENSLLIEAAVKTLYHILKEPERCTLVEHTETLSQRMQKMQDFWGMTRAELFRSSVHEKLYEMIDDCKVR